MDVPDDPPVECPVCETAYDSVSVHEEGVMVNLLDNDRYRRVCFEPTTRGGRSVMRFYHHTHEQTDADGERTDGSQADATADSEPGG
ncbi:hypothetical protein ACOZ4N_03725 [Halorientalis pallida]|uniref:hypothetical protein n=1 Tax=Halorientalis pallida TaxID=2479928 RepID=UPI003C704C2C